MADIPRDDGPGAVTDRMFLTVQAHIFQQQRLYYPNATGEFSWLLSGITLATKMIESRVRRAGLNDLLGALETSNPQGEVQQKLDVFANRALLQCLGLRDAVRVLASEENETPIVLSHNKGSGKYAVVFDPLDGSSNIDVNVGVGTIFSILRCPDPDTSDAAPDDGSRDVLQRGTQQVAAGYVVYGSSTVFVYTFGRGVHCFTLDPAVGAFVLSNEHVRMPRQGPYYSVNEAHRDGFPKPYRTFLDGLRQGEHGRKYASRYIGSLVADFHRTLLKGGVFLYPPTSAFPDGKLRLLYEANPIAFIAEQAGGRASTGAGRVLEVVPNSIHQRTPFVVGSEVEMKAFADCMKSHPASESDGST